MDNTLFPTRILNTNYKMITKKRKDFVDLTFSFKSFLRGDSTAYFNKVADKIILPIMTLLEKACELASKVFIVTNASWRWIETVFNLLPGLARFVSSKNVLFFSTYRSYPKDVPVPVPRQKGKLHALYSILKDREEITNIISIGDSNDERQIVHSVERYLIICLCIYYI